MVYTETTKYYMCPDCEYSCTQFLVTKWLGLVLDSLVQSSSANFCQDLYINVGINDFDTRIYK